MPLTLYGKGGQYTNPGYQEINNMISERGAAALQTPPSLADQSGLVQRISLINGFRSAIEDLLPFFLNDVVHASGSIEGASTITAWNKESILTALSIGGEDGSLDMNWTNVPDADKGGDAWDLANFNQYADVLVAGPTLYDVWLNELMKVADRLKYPIIPVTWPTLGDRSGASFAEVTCATQKAAAIAAWNASSFSGSSGGSGSDFGTSIRRYALFSGAPQGFLQSTRGKARANLSGFATGSAKLYLKLGRATRGSSPKYFGQTRPNTSAEDTYGEWAAAGLAAGSINTTGFVDTTEDVPAFDTPVDTCLAAILGWYCSAQICIGTPTWTYHL